MEERPRGGEPTSGHPAWEGDAPCACSAGVAAAPSPTLGVPPAVAVIVLNYNNLADTLDTLAAEIRDRQVVVEVEPAEELR